MLNIHRLQIAFLLLPLGASFSSNAQFFSKWAKQNDPERDNRHFSYGFQVGAHSSNYTIKYSEEFVTPKLDTVHSVISSFRPGFMTGFLVNMRLNEFWDLRIMPQAGFYGLAVTYRYTNRTSQSYLVESTLLELPLLIKYNSQRRGNVRMYMVGGITPAFQLSGKRAESTSSVLDISKQNFTLNTGLGFDFYYPFFKLSMEVRFSKGMANVLNSRTGNYAAPIQSLNTNTIGVYFIIQ